MIDKVILHDFEEQHSPPSKNILEMSVVGDIVFISLSEYNETYDTTQTSRVAQVAVPLRELTDALRLLKRYDAV